MSTVAHGAAELQALGKRLKATGNGELRKEMLRGFRVASKETIKDIKAGALATLPNRGGLNALVARSSIGTRTRLTGNSAGVRIVATSKTVKQLERMDERGEVRAPTFGNREAWHTVKVRPGWFHEPIEKDADTIRKELVRVMDDVARKVVS